jgi:Predicted CoA-binding protein
MNSTQNLKEILLNVKNIAVVGASPKSDRDSYVVMETLMHFGYKIFPVNLIMQTIKF